MKELAVLVVGIILGVYVSARYVEDGERGSPGIGEFNVDIQRSAPRVAVCGED